MGCSEHALHWPSCSMRFHSEDHIHTATALPLLLSLGPSTLFTPKPYSHTPTSEPSEIKPTPSTPPPELHQSHTRHLNRVAERERKDAQVPSTVSISDLQASHNTHTPSQLATTTPGRTPELKQSLLPHHPSEQRIFCIHSFPIPPSPFNLNLLPPSNNASKTKPTPLSATPTHPPTTSARLRSKNTDQTPFKEPFPQTTQNERPKNGNEPTAHATRTQPHPTAPTHPSNLPQSMHTPS